MSETRNRREEERRSNSRTGDNNISASDGNHTSTAVAFRPKVRACV